MDSRFFHTALIAAFIFSSCGGEKIRTPEILPFYGPPTDGKGNSLSYERAYSIPAFSFTDQHGNEVTINDLKGKICISNYFFATCQGICPKMNGQLKRVYDRYRDDQNIVFLSHTVDPENDSAAALLDYSEKLGVRSNAWHFVTGDKTQLYDQAITGYYLPVSEGTKNGQRFIHSDKLVLLDSDQHIRGYYTGTDSLEVDQLIRDIKRLKNEQMLSKEYLDSLIKMQTKCLDVTTIQ